MIVLPRRSVTRFFIPMIDVLILLFCAFLLVPFSNRTDAGTASAGDGRRKRLAEATQRRQVHHFATALGQVSNGLAHQFEALARRQPLRRVGLIHQD